MFMLLEHQGHQIALLHNVLAEHIVAQALYLTALVMKSFTVNLEQTNQYAMFMLLVQWELLNVFQADEIGCHIITATSDVLNKLKLVGKDLGEYSLDTVKMFYKDAQAAGYQIMTLEEAV